MMMKINPPKAAGELLCECPSFEPMPPRKSEESLWIIHINNNMGVCKQRPATSLTLLTPNARIQLENPIDHANPPGLTMGIVQSAIRLGPHTIRCTEPGVGHNGVEHRLQTVARHNRGGGKI